MKRRPGATVAPFPERPKTVTPVDLATLARLGALLDEGLSPAAALAALARGIAPSLAKPAKPDFPAPEAPVRARLARLAALRSNCTSPYDALMTLARISATIKA